ncbi:MAG: AAA family ATPase [Draconibacterium sp.]
MNPFLLSGYKGPDYFCDRKDETRRILNAIENSRNITLVSERKLGKTALLNHVSHFIPEQTSFLYIDLYPTQNIEGLIKVLANAIIQKLEPFNETILRKITQFFKALNAKFSFDPQTGLPNLELSVNSKDEMAQSIELLFRYIKQSPVKVTLAFDEFQQVLNYPEKNMEAVLRTEIQKDSDTCFIFCGSHTRLLLSMFNQYSRPFYQSTEIMELKPVEQKKYTLFIQEKFSANGIELSLDEANFIYELNKGITYNIQYLCNKLYASGNKKIDKPCINEMLEQILVENEILYYNYRSLLTTLHFTILRAIAKEDVVKKPLSQSFIGKYNLGSASSVKSAISNLEGKGFLMNNNGWRVTDWYFSLWLKRQL